MSRSRRYNANTVDNLIPEIWANESLLILEERMVMANLVHRDFSNEVAEYGETVHTRRPSEFTARRKTNADAVTTQDVSTTGVDVVLNQHVHVSFVIKDGEQTKAFKDLVAYYLQPAMAANARLLDQSLCGQAYQFFTDRAGTSLNMRGGLDMLTSSTAKGYLIDIRDLMNQRKVYEDGRNLVLQSASEAMMLNTDLFVSAEKVGDNGTALREASLGRKFGINTFMDINTPAATAATQGTATTVSGAVAAGASSVVSVGEIVQGQYFTCVGDMTPLRASAVSAGTASYTVTTTRPTLRAIADGAVLQPYAQGAVVGAVASGYVKEISVDGTGVPHVGQLVSFNNTGGGAIRTPEYMICQVTDNTTYYDILLDRPLETALADNDVVNYGPNGEYNFAFHRNAVALVNRPLALPMDGTGARAAVASYNDMSMRVVITYDGLNQGHRVTLDGLFGVAVLDKNLGGVLLG